MKNFSKLFEGRLGRLHYFLGKLIICGTGTLVVMIYPNMYLFAFFITVLTLPLTIRRLHDVNMHGLLAFIAFIDWLSYFQRWFFVIAVIFNLFLLFKKGNKESNKYGEVPQLGLKFIDAVLNKIINGENANKNKKIHIAFKIIGLVFGIILFLIAALIQGERTTKNIFRSIENKPTILYADQTTIPEFIKYTDTEKKSGFKFSILFPTSNPEIYDVDLKGIHVKSYQAHHILDLEAKKFAQYFISISVLQDGKILSKEAIKAYLTNYPEGKIAQFNGVLIKKEITTFKELMAVEYMFNSETYEIKKMHKGIIFIFDGIPIDLGVIYTTLTPESNVYYDDYIKSFAISNK